MLHNNSNQKLILIDFDETITNIHSSGMIRRMKHLSISYEDLLTNQQKQNKIWQVMLSKNITSRGNSENNNQQWRQLFEEVIDSGYEIMILTYSEFPFVIDLFMREILQLDQFYLTKIYVIYGIAHDFGKSHILRAQEIAQKSYKNSWLLYIENELLNIEQGKSMGIETLHVDQTISDPLLLIREKLNFTLPFEKKPSQSNTNIQNGPTFLRFNTQKLSNANGETIKGFHYILNSIGHLEYSETEILVPNRSMEPIKKVRFNLPVKNEINETDTIKEKKPRDYRRIIALGGIIGLGVCTAAFIFLPKKIGLTAKALISIILGIIGGFLSSILFNMIRVQFNRFFPSETTDLPTILPATMAIELTTHEENHVYPSPIKPEVKIETKMEVSSDFTPTNNKAPLNTL